MPPVAGGKSVTPVVPFPFTCTRNALPLGSSVRSGLLPVESNMPKANVLPDVPFGELSAGPLKVS
jgi:hypothetical protein